PTKLPRHPTRLPCHPTRPSCHPTKTPHHPTKPPRHPTRPPCHPTRPPCHPTKPSCHPTRHPNYPTNPPLIPHQGPPRPCVSQQLIWSQRWAGRADSEQVLGQWRTQDWLPLHGAIWAPSQGWPPVPACSLGSRMHPSPPSKHPWLCTSIAQLPDAGSG
uniref:Uncharacterized protein n=1 Tax=Buteo japonicus TaxID=224669 RepID=A0A8C0B2C0_9AVES